MATETQHGKRVPAIRRIAIVAALLQALVACSSSGAGSDNEVDTAVAWLESMYGSSGEQIDFGCSVGPSTAAGLDWYPEIGFSLQSLEDAWARICG